MTLNFFHRLWSPRCRYKLTFQNQAPHCPYFVKKVQGHKVVVSWLNWSSLKSHYIALLQWEFSWFCIASSFVILFPQAETSYRKHRPIGVGVQGLADAFILMRYPFESEEAQQLNKRIFETIYFAALEASCELATEVGPYETYEGSPVSKGVNKLWIINHPSSF